MINQLPGNTDCLSRINWWLVVKTNLKTTKRLINRLIRLSVIPNTKLNIVFLTVKPKTSMTLSACALGESSVTSERSTLRSLHSCFINYDLFYISRIFGSLYFVPLSLIERDDLTSSDVMTNYDVQSALSLGRTVLQTQKFRRVSFNNIIHGMKFS